MDTVSPIVARKPSPRGPAWIRLHFFRFAGDGRPFGGRRTAKISESRRPEYLRERTAGELTDASLAHVVADGPRQAPFVHRRGVTDRPSAGSRRQRDAQPRGVGDGARLVVPASHRPESRNAPISSVLRTNRMSPTSTG